MSHSSFCKCLMLLIAMVIFVACSSGSEEADGDTPHFTPPDTDMADGDLDNTQTVNASGAACSAQCNGTQSHCLVAGRPFCPGYCVIPLNETAGVCADRCDVGEGCPSGTYCLDCPVNPDWSGYCVSNSLLNWFSDICTADTDGDQDVVEENESEQADTQEQDEAPQFGCLNEADCPEGEHCLLEQNKCFPACDPYSPTCTGGSVCHVIMEGELAGQGTGLCIDQISYGRDIGQLCVGDQLCKMHYVCFLNDHCTEVCDPNAEVNTCPNDQLCHLDPPSGVGVCTRCSEFVPCPEDYACESGICVEKVYCDNYEDCERPMTCIMGYCQEGCQATGCPEGVCNGTTGYCETYCLPPCEEGQCCNDGECGPCCDPPCFGRSTCRVDPSCAPEEFCCIESPDCREQLDPDIWCDGPLVCDEQTGDCIPECPPEGCPWGYYCNRETGFICDAIPPEPCQMGLFCSEPCFVCHMTQEQCVPWTSCPIQCVPTYVSCGIGIGQVPCCFGDVCCLEQNGFATCCPQGDCVEGVGCTR